MGMFDYIRFDGVTYQTKDFDCEMDNYSIENGKLFKEVGHTEMLPEEKWERYELFNSEYIQKTEWVSDGMKEVPYHGFLHFYGTLYKAAPYGWICYHAKFTDGALVSVECVERNDPKSQPATESEAV